VRDWDRIEADVERAGARLLVLTADSPDVARGAAKRAKLRATLVPVDASLWVRWGLANERRTGLPHPSTVVVAPDGTIIDRETHTNYKVRAEPAAVLDRITAHRVSGSLAPTAVEEPDDEGPDWDGALRVTATLTDGGAALDLRVAQGFHVYGAAERTARPLNVRIDQQPDVLVPIPQGERKELGGGLGESWVLSGSVRLEVTTEAPGGVLSGELDVQLCTESACSAPATRRWSTGQD
jgi:hypothetical protein